MNDFRSYLQSIPKPYIYYRGGATKLGNWIRERKYRRKLQKEADERYKQKARQSMEAYVQGKPDPNKTGPADFSGITNPITARQWLLENGILPDRADNLQVQPVLEWARKTLPTLQRQYVEQAIPLIQHPERAFEEMLKYRSGPVDNSIKTEPIQERQPIIPATIPPAVKPAPIPRTPAEKPVPKIHTEPIVDIPPPPEKEQNDPVADLWEDYYDSEMENEEPTPEPEPDPKPKPVKPPEPPAVDYNQNPNAKFIGINASGFMGTRKLKKNDKAMKAYMQYVRSFKPAAGKKRTTKKQTQKAFMQYVRSFK